MSTRTTPRKPVTAPVLQVHRPADGTVLAELPMTTAAQVHEKVEALRVAQPAWEALGVAGRARHLENLRDWLLDNQERMLGLMQAEAGKPRADAMIELGWMGDIVNTMAAGSPKWLADRHVRPHLPLLATRRFTVVRRPFPVVGVIGPWNFPTVLCAGDGIPALFAGAVVLLKPSEITPLACAEVVRAWREDIGAPPVLDVAIGLGEVGAALVDAVDFVHFTGSVRTGMLVAERAAKTVTPVSLELGGKDPFVVLRDSNIARAANCAVFSGLANNGQVCVSTERIYVEAPIYDEFVARVVANVRALRRGTDGPHIGVELGAMTSAAQIGIVEDHVREAISKGARVLTGGSRVERAGNWFEPTVLVDVDHSMKVMVEETFGPVLPIMKVADAEEAIRLANDSEFGLSATVFSGDVKRGEQVARRIEAGSVNVNDYGSTTTCLDVPMGGWKKSGIGSRAGSTAVTKYTRTQAIASPRVPTLDTEAWWFPYSPLKQGVVEWGLRLLNARGLRRLGLRRDLAVDGR
ncbi:aldehyde dehydrogenase family protein [Nocardia concava]|uniref:aldehyde dehydrogenase family protein n=1 Tax=Nocardia concava TaxID=257281 RepID=UPI0002E9E7F9|nr:aldehyde dehydrogenase family protein [Nocardia concava]